MSIELRWKASLSSTCLHAAACRRAGVPAANPELSVALDAASDALLEEISAAGWPIDATIHELAGLSGEFEHNQPLADQAAMRLMGPSAAGTPASQRVAGAVADLEAALLRAQPEIVDELAARGRPIREQWEARGPGLLMGVGRLTEKAVIPECAEVVLVGPYAGGGGLAHLKSNRVLLEALLFNPAPELPEVVRLAWLLAQLNGDLPRFAECLPANRLMRTIQLATLPPVLAAGEVVELSHCDASTAALALETWRLADGNAEGLAEVLLQWWSACVGGATRWPVALAALDKMLAG